MTLSMPTWFISHGGGPWSFMDDQRRPLYAKLEASLREMAAEVGEGAGAVLCISAHWEESQFTVMAAEHPPMVYDYYGFPEYTYRISYPAPGSPTLAGRVRQLLQQADFAANLDRGRGFDHGAFTPLAVAWPQAEMPVVQLSLRADLDPAAHLAAGRALAPLRDEGVLIVASGFSYHNLRMFAGPEARTASSRFDGWLRETLSESTPEERVRRLLEWEQAPSAREAHPREEHLIPLMVAVGAAEGEAAAQVYHEDDFLNDITVSSYRFG